MSINRTATQKAPGRGQSVRRAPTQKARRTKSYDDVSQGIKQLYPENGSDDCNIDIVLVPGLGAHPEKCWESEHEKSKFNWTTDKDAGLVKDFPKARVLLYMYESAWIGGYKVKQFMDNIARFLVITLNNMRKVSAHTCTLGVPYLQCAFIDLQIPTHSLHRTQHGRLGHRKGNSSC